MADNQTGQRGPLWRHDERPTEVFDALKAPTVERYIHLNPCRARLTRCPLAWPWSTHRDRVGLALPALWLKTPDPPGFHAWISGDPSTDPGGTPMPVAGDVLTGTWGDLLTVQAAVSTITRQTLDELHRRGPGRTLLIRATTRLTQAPTRLIADFTGFTPRAVRKVDAAWAPELTRVARVLGDPRFTVLDAADLRRQSRCSRYLGRR